MQISIHINHQNCACTAALLIITVLGTHSNYFLSNHAVKPRPLGEDVNVDNIEFKSLFKL